MSSWTVVLLPALVTALLVRLDAKLVGPYFALSELVGASDSVTARDFYESHTLRAALARRLMYPLLLGVALSWASSLPLWEIGVVGLLTAALLLWPLIFHGLPFGVSRRDWELPVLYATFLGTYAGLAVSGGLMRRLFEFAVEGDVRKWLADQFLGSFAAWLCVLFLAAIYRVMFARLGSKAKRREAIGREYDWHGDSTMVDAPPPESP